MLKRLLFELKYRRADPYQRAELYRRFYNIKMGKDCKFFGKADFGSEPYLIELGNRVMLSDKVAFFTHDGGVQVLTNLGYANNADSFGRIKISNNVFIGRGATILKDVEVGENVVIGAGAVVTKDCQPNSVYAGVPARRIKSIDEYYEGCKDTLVETADIDPREKAVFLQERYGLK